MATGFVDSGVEALYGLDHLTGDLFCGVLNSRTGDVANRFRVSGFGNVMETEPNNRRDQASPTAEGQTLPLAFGQMAIRLMKLWLKR